MRLAYSSSIPPLRAANGESSERQLTDTRRSEQMGPPPRLRRTQPRSDRALCCVFHATTYPELEAKKIRNTVSPTLPTFSPLFPQNIPPRGCALPRIPPNSLPVSASPLLESVAPSEPRGVIWQGSSPPQAYAPGGSARLTSSSGVMQPTARAPFGPFSRHRLSSLYLSIVYHNNVDHSAFTSVIADETCFVLYMASLLIHSSDGPWRLLSF